ncbi:hypothetical protein BC826DRAFT_1025829, partial [Russula brevipes]
MSKALVPATTPLDEPLRSSLKCPSSPVPVHGDAPAPVFPDTPPPNRKRVRFKDGDEAVESICVFRPDGRPSALLTAHSSDTESETEESEEDAPSLPQYISNLAFEKRVAARFTTDGWTTVSESLARYTGPAPHVPGQGDGDGATAPGTASCSPSPSSCAPAPRRASSSSPCASPRRASGSGGTTTAARTFASFSLRRRRR